MKNYCRSLGRVLCSVSREVSPEIDLSLDLSPLCPFSSLLVSEDTLVRNIEKLENFFYFIKYCEQIAAEVSPETETEAPSPLITSFLPLLSGISFAPRPASFAPDFRFSVEPTDVVVMKDRAAAALHCSTVDSSAVVRWRRNGEFLRFPDFHDRR